MQSRTTIHHDISHKPRVESPFPGRMRLSQSCPFPSGAQLDRILNYLVLRYTHAASYFVDIDILVAFRFYEILRPACKLSRPYRHTTMFLAGHAWSLSAIVQDDMPEKPPWRMFMRFVSTYRRITGDIYLREEITRPAIHLPRNPLVSYSKST